jgi:hypothetical protein
MNLYMRIESLFMHLSRSRRVDGMWLGVNGDKDDEHLLGCVEAALGVIKQHDSPRYRRLLRDVKRIWITVLPGPRGSFSSAFDRCDLDCRFVAESPPETIASTIVHEATHAHPCLRKFGYPEHLRHRIEGICMRQQLAFADRLPNGRKIREEVGRNLSRSQSDWSSEALEKSYLAGRLAAARHLGVPEWLLQSLLKLRTMRERVRRMITRPNA